MASSPQQSDPATPAEEGPLPETPDGSTTVSPIPRAGQPVFEQLPSSKVTRSRQIVITALVILANLVQVGKKLFLCPLARAFGPQS